MIIDDARLITACSGCESQELEEVLDLGVAPPPCIIQRVGERPAAELSYPLTLLRCAECTLVQMGVDVRPETIFPSDYGYSSGNSKQLVTHFNELAMEIGDCLDLERDDLIVDIGANDGTLLSQFNGVRLLGIEPTAQGEKMDELDIPHFRAFFDQHTGAYLANSRGKAKVVLACNVLAHVEDVHDTLEGIAALLDEGGVLVAENHDLDSVVSGGQWDTVYHEHRRFFDPFSFSKLLELHDFRITRVDSISTHGGSFRVWADRSPGATAEIPQREYDFGALDARAQAVRTVLRGMLASYCGERVIGVGATARATTMINYCGLSHHDIEAVCEVAGSDKIGTYIPNTRIPVIEQNLALATGPDALLLFSWHLAEHIVPRLRESYVGPIIFPLPDVSTELSRSQFSRVTFIGEK